MREFFIVVPPGLEEDLVQELREVEPFLIGPDGRPDLKGLGEIRPERGGVSLRAEPLAVLQLHFWLKTAARVLLRLETFHAIEFFQLEKALKRVSLETWIGAGTPFHLQVDSARSKLGQEKRIFETARKIFGARLLDPADESAGERLLLRAEADQFTLSLDLTGEHLHRRATGRELGGPAPIRETLAAALVRFLIDRTPLSELRQVELMDPMAGSGTLLAEAAGLYRPLAGREFAFQKQPWIPKLLKSPQFLANARGVPERTWQGLWATDASDEARSRLASLAGGLAETLHIEKPGDEARASAAAAVWVIANPPYGERLEALPPDELARLLLRRNPARVAVILPKKKADELERIWPVGWTTRKKPVQNGGLPCLFLVFTKNAP
jgi:putative N6-adenine-specific DNA methylase